MRHLYLCDATPRVWALSHAAGTGAKRPYGCSASVTASLRPEDREQHNSPTTRGRTRPGRYADLMVTAERVAA